MSILRMRPNDDELAPSLAFFLRRHGCHVDLDEDGTLVVEPPHEVHDMQARLEVQLYVRLWAVLHDADVTITG